jgi:hypothetical protein
MVYFSLVLNLPLRELLLGNRPLTQQLISPLIKGR